ncbi:MAG: hypothetical protein WDM84_09165 [Bauldia sp.]
MSRSVLDAVVADPPGLQSLGPRPPGPFRARMVRAEVGLIEEGDGDQREQNPHHPRRRPQKRGDQRQQASGTPT